MLAPMMVSLSTTARKDLSATTIKTTPKLYTLMAKRESIQDGV